MSKTSQLSIVVGTVILAVLVVAAVGIKACTNIADGPPVAQAKPPAPALRSDIPGATAELRKIPWVKDVVISSGWANIGVMPREKDWTSPMIAKHVNAVLVRHGVEVSFIRFVDAPTVAHRRMTPREASIAVFDAQSFRQTHKVTP